MHSLMVGINSVCFSLFCLLERIVGQWFRSSKSQQKQNADDSMLSPRRIVSHRPTALLLLFAGLLLGSTNAMAVSCTSIASTNWGTLTTWGAGGCVGAGTGGGETAGIPGINDTVIIASGFTVNLAANAKAASITINNAGAATGITLSGFTLNVSGAVTLSAPTVNATSTFNVGTGTLTAASISITSGTSTQISLMTVSSGIITTTGNIVFAGIASSARFTSTGASTVNVGGNFGSSGTLTTSGTGTINFNGGAAQTIGIYTTYNKIKINNTSGGVQILGTTTIGGTLDVSLGTLDIRGFTLTVTGATTVSSTLLFSTSTGGTKTFVGAVTINSGGIWNNAINESFTVRGGITHNGATFTAGTGTYTFNTNNQALAGSNGMTFGGAVTITGAITLTNNNTNTVTVTGALNGSVAGSTWANGANSTLSYGNATAPMVTGVLTVSASPNTVNYSKAGTQTVKATTYHHLGLSGSSAKTFTSATINGNLDLSGSATATLTGVTAVIGNLTLSGTSTATTAVGFTIGGNLTVGSGTTFTSANFTNLVSGTTSVTGTLAHSGAAVKTYTGSVTINTGGSLTNAGNAAINFLGNLAQSGTFSPGSGTITLNGSVAQTLSGTGALGFANLTVSNTGGITLARDVTVTSAIIGTHPLTNTCPTDYMLTSNSGLTIEHSCLVSANTGGSNFNCLETVITPYNSGTARLYTKRAGSPFSFDVVALNISGAVESNYVVSGYPAKNVTVELFDDSTPVSCSAYASPIASQTLSFGSANAGRKTTANFSVANAYAKLICRVTDANGGPTVYGCSSDDFSVRPSAPILTTSASAVAPSASATPVIKAGAVFTIGATTSPSNYTGTLALDVNKLTAQLPSNGSTPQSGGTVGSLTLSPVVQANASPAQSGNAIWDQVGYLYASAGAFRDDSFTSVDQAGDCVSSTVADANLADTFDVNNKIGCSIGNTTAVSFGRFKPDHFDVTVNSNATMAAACSSGGFTYLGQSMTYGTAPSLTIKPVNAATGGSVTQNYTGFFQKLTASGITITTPTADGTQNGKDGLTKTTLSAVMSAGGLANSSGTLTYTLNAGDQYTYTRNANALIGAYASNIPLVVSAVSDGEVSATGSMPTLSPSGVSLRYGRLNLANGYGSELLDLPVPLTAENWNGNSWVKNTDDKCTTGITLSAAVATGPITNICAWDSGTPGSSGLGCSIVGTSANKFHLPPLVTDGGNFNLNFKAPGTGNTGAMDITATVPGYLKFNWKGAGDINPTARATFGIYQGNKHFIYFREAY